jgi:hypothetical protein
MNLTIRQTFSLSLGVASLAAGLFLLHWAAEAAGPAATVINPGRNSPATAGTPVRYLKTDNTPSNQRPMDDDGLVAVVNASQPTPAFANLTVLVTRANANTVISGAAVCVSSSSGAPRSDFTDAGGQAIFSGIAPGQVTIIVSCAGFTGQSHTSPLDAAGGTALFRLSAGSGGPVCSAVPPRPPPGPAVLAITSFDWHLNRQTPLFFEAALAFAATKTPGGAVVPTHYRVGESSDLSNKPWTAYSGGVITFQFGYLGNSLTGYGLRTLFFQVKHEGVESQVASKTVALAPARTNEFRFEGANLAAMLNYAKDRGFQFTTFTVSATQGQCEGIEFKLNSLGFAIPSGQLRDRVWQKVVAAQLLFIGAKRFTSRWRVKSIEVGQSDHPVGSQVITGAPDGDGFKVTITITVPAVHGATESSLCFANPLFPLKAIVLEGPADDLALDQANRWKNMFPPN